MRRIIRFSIAGVAVALSFACAGAAAAQTAPPSPLHFGQKSHDVLVLQQKLNASPDTRVSDGGPGSPGMETDYFGAKTLDAVRRFQAKYSRDILVPAGLSAPSGVAGPLTLEKLQQLAAPTAASPAAVPEPPAGEGSPTQEVDAGTPYQTGQTVSLPDATSSLQMYINTVTQIETMQGMSPQTVAQVAEKIRQTEATATDFKAQFFKEQQALYAAKTSLINQVLGAIAGFFLPQTAQALSVGLFPFGGYLTYINPAICDCPPGIITQLYVFLPNPTITSNLLLNYVNGTEAFNWHNIPEPGIATVGSYAPVTQGCFTWVGHICIPIPSRGTITPMVGSSLPQINTGNIGGTAGNLPAIH